MEPPIVPDSNASIDQLLANFKKSNVSTDSVNPFEEIGVIGRVIFSFFRKGLV